LSSNHSALEENAQKTEKELKQTKRRVSGFETALDHKHRHAVRHKSVLLQLSTQREVSDSFDSLGLEEEIGKQNEEMTEEEEAENKQKENAKEKEKDREDASGIASGVARLRSKNTQLKQIIVNMTAEHKATTSKLLLSRELMEQAVAQSRRKSEEDAETLARAQTRIEELEGKLRGVEEKLQGVEEEVNVARRERSESVLSEQSTAAEMDKRLKEMELSCQVLVEEREEECKELLERMDADCKLALSEKEEYYKIVVEELEGELIEAKMRAATYETEAGEANHRLSVVKRNRI
jgi:hypothetical protein